MSSRFSPTQILKDLRSGPGWAEPPTAYHVAVSSERYPPQYERALTTLFYRMVDEQMRKPKVDVVGKYQRFSQAWRGNLNDDASKFYFASLAAYSAAMESGLGKLDHSTAEEAQAVVAEMIPLLPVEESAEGLAWRTLFGQIQSVYSRHDAAASFVQVRQHSHISLISLFYRDTGALTYYCDEEVQKRKHALPSLSQMRSWSQDPGATAHQAMVISVDPNFFRIYGPMMLFNAQQLPDLDFVIVLCAPDDEATALQHDMQAYLESLSDFNKQPVPQNVRIIGVKTPSWVGNQVTFYASARFLAIPELLEQYDSLYVMDADLFLTSDPRAYFQRYQDLEIAVPLTRGLAGVCPWRRHMAGSLVANKYALDGAFLSRFLDYLSVGLADPKSWMLDQNALSYAVDGVRDEYVPLSKGIPVATGRIMGVWERNYKTSCRSRVGKMLGYA